MKIAYRDIIQLLVWRCSKVYIEIDKGAVCYDEVGKCERLEQELV